MKRYQDRSGDSGVLAYEVGADFIDIKFTDGGIYRYDGHKPGAAHVKEMIRLARAGDGLNTYINQHVRANYAARLR